MEHFIQYTLYSKFIENSANFTPSMYLVIIIFYMLYTNSSIYFYIKRLIFSNPNIVIVSIPYHKKVYNLGQVKNTRIIYSLRFLAINHYLKTHSTNIISFVEIMNFENARYYDDNKSEFVLLPDNSHKMCICKKRDIYLEIGIDTDIIDEKNAITKNGINYIFTLSIPKKENMHILLDFIETCQKQYESDITKIKEQMIWEYIKTYENDDSPVMNFESTPFKSNKNFDNIFFEGKSKVIEEIRPFSKKIGEDERRECEEIYKRIGMPYKLTYLLYGPPGTGKTSLIKSIVNYTGRHCVLVQWSRIKTASDFQRLLHQIKIDSNILSQSELCVVFEDFDANNCSEIKCRENMKKIQKTTESTDTLEKTIKNAIETCVPPMKPLEDELTLEAILNALDGIRELHNALIIFTTNDIISIDPALIRPGRIDRKIEMKLASKHVIKNILSYYYQANLDNLDFGNLPAISPARLQEAYKNNTNPEDCLAELVGDSDCIDAANLEMGLFYTTAYMG